MQTTIDVFILSHANAHFSLVMFLRVGGSEAMEPRNQQLTGDCNNHLTE